MTRLRRTLAILLSLVLAVVIALAATWLVFMHRFYPHSPAADYPPAHDLTTAQRQDLDYFRHYFALNRTYTPAARLAAETLLAQDEALAGQMTPAQFDLAVMRMVALADNGHSQVFRGPLSRANNRMPCRLYPFADGYYVIRAKGACAPLLGARLVAIDDHALPAILDAMFVYAGGTRTHYDQYSAVYFLESPALLNAAGLAREAASAHWMLAMPDGTLRSVSLTADAPDVHAPRIFANRNLSPRPIEGEAAGWVTALPADAALPLFLRDYDTPFQQAWWPERGVYYAQFKSNEDEPGHPIGAFVDQVTAGIRANKPRAVIVDLRFDQGGNFTTTAGLMKHLTDLADSVQHVYVLTSGWTFSAGNVSLALARAHGGDKVNVLGEPVGDRIRLWAEGGDLVLPNSKLDIGFATGLHDYAKSCAGEDGCFWVMYFYPMRVKSLLPDLHVAYDYSDYVALRDPVLERALMLASAVRSR